MTTCTICADQLTENLSALPCRHAFHHDCIQAWFRQKPSCPNCNANFNRNSIVGPLFLDDARQLHSSIIQTTNIDPLGDIDLDALRSALTQSESKVAQLQRDNIELSQKVRYLKSLRTLLEADSRTHTVDAQIRMQHWMDMGAEQLAGLLEESSRKTKDAEEQLVQVRRENANLRINIDEWRREKEFFESRYDRLRKSMKDAQKRKPRARDHGVPSGSVAGTSSQQASQATVVDDSDQYTDDEISTRRVVPKAHSSSDSSRKKQKLFPFGVSSSSRASIKQSLSLNRSNKRSRLNTAVGAKRRREEENEESDDDEGSTTDDGLDDRDQNRDDDSEDNDLNDIEIVPSRIESRSRNAVHSPSPPIIDLLSDDE